MSWRTFIDAVSTLAKQHWKSYVDSMSVNQRCFSWNLAENESWANVCLPTLFQRWQNNVETALKLFRRFNIDGLMLFQYWYLVENESWVNPFSSALPQCWEKSIETTLPIFLVLMFIRKWLNNETNLSLKV